MDPEQLLSFWIGPLDQDGLAAPEVAQRWWRKDPAFDAELTATYAPELEAALRGAYESWRDEPRSLLAYVILLDQLSRNVHRGRPAAFAADERALVAAEQGLVRGFDRSLRGHERVFLYMPFMHSESLSEQERCVALFRAFRDEASGRLREALDANLDFAVRHRDVVARFGRFPHRNAILGRPSTVEELAFLEQPNSSF